MKKRLLYLCLLLPLLGCFASCDDDSGINNEYAETSGDNWDGLSGTYRGKMYVSFDGVAVDTIYQQAEIVSDNRNKMTLSISSIIVNDDIYFNNEFFKNVFFTKEGNTASFRAETVQSMGRLSNVSLTLRGTIEGGNIDLTIDASSVVIRPIKMQLKGDKLDKPLSSESEILKVTLKHPYITSQPDFSYGTFNGNYVPVILVYITDTLKLTDSTEILIRPEFELSKGATISHPDSVMNFAGKSLVSYTVWAEDSIHRTTYYAVLVQAMVRSCPFTTWKNTNGWEEPENGWATNNGAFRKIVGDSYQGAYPVTRVKGQKTGEWAAQMETVMPKNGDKQKLFSGSIFQGNFDLTMQAPLYGPQYGTAFSGQPVTVRGYYKYAPGKEMYADNALYQDTVPMSDTCHIQAILYEVVNPDDCLDSLNYMLDPKLIAVANMPNQQGGRYQPEFKQFTLTFQYMKAYSFLRRYKIALLCGSSAHAGKGNGAPGSRLTVGGIEVMYTNK